MIIEANAKHFAKFLKHAYPADTGYIHNVDLLLAHRLRRSVNSK